MHALDTFRWLIADSSEKHEHEALLKSLFQAQTLFLHIVLDLFKLQLPIILCEKCLISSFIKPGLFSDRRVEELSKKRVHEMSVFRSTHSVAQVFHIFCSKQSILGVAVILAIQYVVWRVGRNKGTVFSLVWYCAKLVYLH